MLDESVSMLGRFARRVYSDETADHNIPIAAVEDDEPDALTEVPAPATPVGPIIAVPEVTHPGDIGLQWPC